jgi:SAM-dependent MidA family methyltransferase
MGPDLGARSSPFSHGGAADDPLDPALRQRLRSQADEVGFLRFDRFMDIVLYEPGLGYYDRPDIRLGREGDFYTAAHVHGLYGAVLAAHFRELRASEGSPLRFPIVEVGPGDGTLAMDILHALRGSSVHEETWEYILVERSATLRSAIQVKLGPSSGRAPAWRFGSSVGSEGPVRGIVFGNELLDAFPARRFLRTESGWAELGTLVPDRGALHLVTCPGGGTVLPEGLPPAVPTGSTFEISSMQEAWIREVADHLAGGRLLLIDYGAEEDPIVDRGSEGTIQAIRGHRTTDPTAFPGTADISAWVNFTRLRRAARAAGLRETFYGSFTQAMVAWGIDDVRKSLDVNLSADDRVRLQLAQKSFLLGFPNFRVLELAPSVR